MAGPWLSLAGPPTPHAPKHTFLLRHTLAGEFGYSPRSIQECLAAEATCKTLRAALRGPTLRSLRVGGASQGKQAWALQTHPSAAHLRIYGSAASAAGQAFLQALRPQVRLLSVACRGTP